MGKYSLNEKGEDFIKSACGKGTSRLSGKLSTPLPKCLPPTSPDKTWTSNPAVNGGITTNEQLAKRLIEWYNIYAEIYQVDANIIAAQEYLESSYNVWTYAIDSTASSLGQFTSDTVFTVIIQNWGGSGIEKFTTEEIGLITKGLSGNFLNDKKDLWWSTDIGSRNRPISHQNMIDNPELMVKAHCRYYRAIANTQKTSLTSSVIAGYFQGPQFAKKTYGDTINFATSKGVGNAVIEYVFDVFSVLGNKKNSKFNGHYFGYDQLGMTSPPTADSFNTNLG